MASVIKQFSTSASPEQVWDAIRDVGALHTRLVPGFVVDTRLEEGARVVTFGNGAVVREPIISIDEQARRVVWSAEGKMTSHYNSSVQVIARAGEATQVVWTADFLPDGAAAAIDGAMSAGSAIMKKTLDKLSG